MVNIESVPSEAGPDLGGIEQGIPNDEVEIAAACFAGLAMTPHQMTAYAYLVRGRRFILSCVAVPATAK